MRSVDSWLDEYGESHQNPTNKAIHWICVPLILWTVTALVWSIPAPVEWLNWAVLMALLAMAWYVALSPKLAVGIGLVLAACLAINAWVESAFHTPLWLIAVVVFVAAWIGQFIGHHIEGKKPSFFKDLQFLLVGPAWLMGFVYRKAGWSY
ncbi:MAG: Mpo1-like protein [Wenzhouxiangellaceae bacterium]